MANVLEMKNIYKKYGEKHTEVIALKELSFAVPQIAKTDLGFPITIPVVDAGAILYRIPAMAEPVYQQMESIIHSLNK